MRNILIAQGYENLDLSCKISNKAEIVGASRISIGANTIIHDHAIIQCTGWEKSEAEHGSIKIGANCSIQPFAYIHSIGGKIILGNNCSVNPYTILYGGGGLIIGNNVRIAAHTVIIPANHNFQRSDLLIYQQGVSQLGIQIEDDVWIGSGVCVLDGVCIKRGCVIGAGSVVTHSTDLFGVYVGNPARKIRDRF